MITEQKEWNSLQVHPLIINSKCSRQIPQSVSVRLIYKICNMFKAATEILMISLTLIITSFMFNKEIHALAQCLYKVSRHLCNKVSEAV